jgi:predicted GIY-YIG superfamily endonuclease
MTKPHVLYRYFDADDNLLYVGITNSPLSRMSQHLRDKGWFAKAARTTYEHFTTRDELEKAELKAIQSEKPKYNIAGTVAPPPKQMAVKTNGRFMRGAASSFPKPDAIASDSHLTEEEMEARLDELEKQRRYIIPGTRCPNCDLICLVREYDDVIKCLYCMGAWLPEEMPSDIEVLTKMVSKQKGKSA